MFADRTRTQARRCMIVLVLVGLSNFARAGPIEERRAAIDRAMQFLYTMSSNEENFAKFGSDLLWCFYSISHTAGDRQLGRQAAQFGRELAQRWRKMHQDLPANATANDIYTLVLGSYSADRLGFPDPRLKAELLAASRRFTARDYLGFDAAHEPPAIGNPQRYDIFTDALIHSYFGDAYGVPLGAHHRDVLRWLPRLRPYDGYDEDTEFDIFYAISHVIYTTNDYHERRIRASLLPQEFQFIRRKLADAMSDDDPEMVAEAVDCLKAAGFENDPQVLAAMDYLVSSQRPDGTWAGEADDPYTEYHSAWAAIDGLRDYRFHGRVNKLVLN